MAEPTPRPDIAERLRVLGEQYGRQLPERFAELVRLAGDLRNEASAETIHGLHLWLHSQAGSAPTFGFAELGATSRELENELRKRSVDNDVQDEHWRKDFARRLLRLEPLCKPAVAVAPAGNEPGVDVAKDLPLIKQGEVVPVWVLCQDARESDRLLSILSELALSGRRFQSLEAMEQALQGEMPGLLLMDADLSGVPAGALPEIRAWQARAGKLPPMVVISACSDFDTLMKVTDLGASGFVNRPMDVPRLMETIDAILMEGEAGNRYRVLLIDDDAMLGTYYSEALQAAGIEVKVLQSPRTVLETMSVFRPDVVMLDLNMPDYRGERVARMLRLYNAWPEVPVVYLSAESDAERQINAQEAAGDDFLAKPVTARQLVSAVRVRARRSRLLAGILATDSLTRLLKHTAIKDRLDAECRRVQRSGGAMAVAMVDIDHFKTINDQWGHASGDRVIKGLAHLLRSRLRKSDVVGRYGGDEFLLLFPDSHAAEVKPLLEEIAENFRSLLFGQEDGSFSSTISIGVAETTLFPHSSQLLEAADRALYEVKRGGRNGVRIASMIGQEGTPGG